MVMMSRLLEGAQARQTEVLASKQSQDREDDYNLLGRNSALSG